MLLIDKNTIAKYRQISKSVSDDKINQFIEDAELVDLKPLLGFSLFNKIKKSPEEYKELLEGGCYDCCGGDYRHEGLEKVLAIYAYSRYVMFGSYTDTPFGYVQKQYQDGQQVVRDNRKEVYKAQQQVAYQVWIEVQHYMNCKGLLVQSCKPKSRNFRISKIT